MGWRLYEPTSAPQVGIRQWPGAPSVGRCANRSRAIQFARFAKLLNRQIRVAQRVPVSKPIEPMQTAELFFVVVMSRFNRRVARIQKAPARRACEFDFL